jgi:hypothetical protein
LTSRGAGKLSLVLVARESLVTWRRDFGRLTILAVALEAPIAIAELFWHARSGLEINTDVGFLPTLFSSPLIIYSLLSHHFLSGIIEKFVGAERRGHQKATLLEIITDLPWLRLLLADIALAVLTALGFILLVIPGLVVATLFAIVLPLINLERQPIVATFRRSASLVRGHSGRVFVVWFFTQWITDLGAGLIGYLFHNSSSEVVQVLAHSIPTAILLPIAALPLVVMAFELVDRDPATTGEKVSE